MARFKLILLIVILGILILREVQVRDITSTLIANQNIINNNTNRLNLAALKQNEEILRHLAEIQEKLDKLAAAKPDHSS